MIDTTAIRNRHVQCDCILIHVEESSPSPTVLDHQDCRLRISGLCFAIDCDNCNAFPKDQRRPDLVVLREVDDAAQWLVVEIKSTMRMYARQQVEAGLKTLANDPLFSELADRGPLAILAFTRLRTAGLDRLRQPLRIQGRPVPIRVVRCGDDSVI